MQQLSLTRLENLDQNERILHVNVKDLLNDTSNI